MNTRQIIIDCFKQVKVPTDDRHKHLISILEEKLNSEIEKEKAKHFEDELHSLVCDGFVLEHINTGKKVKQGFDEDWAVVDAYDWNDEKDYKTFKGALNAASK